MNTARFARGVVWTFLAVLFFPSTALAQYSLADSLAATVPGQVYREFSLPIGVDSTSAWRVTHPGATFDGGPTNSPYLYLPNPILELPLSDLEGAVRAVAVIDVWGGHAGTTGKQFRLNGSDWIDVPDIQNTPGAPECYIHQATLEVEVPIEDLVEGTNLLEGTSGYQICYNFNWGQWGWYGFMLRVFYDPATVDAPTADIVRPLSGSTIGAGEVFEVQATGALDIERVDFVGRYDGYDVDGDGVDFEWQESLHRLRADRTLVPRDHIGTVTTAPFRRSWNTEWVPDQPSGGIDVLARVLGENGLWVVADHVTGLTLERPGIQVSDYEPYGLPEKALARAGLLHSSSFDIDVAHDLSTLESARMLVRTWNGFDGGRGPGEDSQVRMNSWDLPAFGQDHFYSYDQIPVPGDELQNGTNTFSFFSESSAHGIEVLWPGPGLVARYEDMSGVPAYVIGALDDVETPEGTSVLFRIEARGEAPLSYQWQRNGVDIDGARASSLELTNIPLGASGDVFRCAVSNANGSAWSDEATLTVLPPGPRTDEGLIARYDFDEGAGLTIFDRTGFGADLVIADSTAVRWLDDALAVDVATAIRTLDAATSIVDPVRASGEVSLEAWIRTADLGQNGPARIVSLSGGSTARNITLGQGVYASGSDRVEVRLRTTGTNDNGVPSLSSPNGSLGPELTHVLFTRSAGGATQLYVDGVLRASSSVFGDLSNWDHAFQLTLANEATNDRPWRGEFHFVAFYDRALSPGEAFANFAAGAPVADVVTSTPTRAAFSLGANMPNPFNPSTVISFESSVTADVLLEVYDLKGRKVRRLLDARRAAGRHALTWNGKDDEGRGVASGVYIYRMRAVGVDGSDFTESRAMLLVK